MTVSRTCSTLGTGTRAAGNKVSTISMEEARNAFRASGIAYLGAGSHSQPTMRRTTGSTSSRVRKRYQPGQAPGGQPDRGQVGVKAEALQRGDERDDEGHQKRQHQRADDRGVARRQLPAPVSSSHWDFPETSVRRIDILLPVFGKCPEGPGWMRCFTSDAYGGVGDRRSRSSGWPS